MPDQDLLFGDIEEGTAYPPFDYTVTDDNARDFAGCFVVDALRRADGTPLAPAEKSAGTVSPFLLNQFYAIRAVISMPMGTLLARETVTLHQPARTGDALRVVLSIKSKQRKNDKGFVVLHHRVTRAADGAEIMEIDRMMFWPK